MKNNRWSMFGWGVALGLLLGATLTGGYFWSQLVEARADGDEARIAEAMARDEAQRQAKIAHAIQQALDAKELEAIQKLIEKARKDR